MSFSSRAAQCRKMENVLVGKALIRNEIPVFGANRDFERNQLVPYKVFSIFQFRLPVLTQSNLAKQEQLQSARLGLAFRMPNSGFDSRDRGHFSGAFDLLRAGAAGRQVPRALCMAEQHRQPAGTFGGYPVPRPAPPSPTQSQTLANALKITGSRNGGK